MNLYIARDGESLGPYNEAQAREYLKTGVFTLEDLGCLAGHEDWQTLGELFSRERFPAPEPTKPVASSVPVVTRSAHEQPPTVQAPGRPPSLVGIFLAAFLGILLAGGLLLAGWHYFLQQANRPAPLVLSSSRPAGAPIVPTFQKPGQLNGDMFIVTQGGQNYKLGAVRVALYPMTALGPFLDEKRAKMRSKFARLAPLIAAAEDAKNQAAEVAKQASEKYIHTSYDDPAKPGLEKYEADANRAKQERLKEWGRLVDDQSAYLTASYWLENLPAALTVTETDADGKFTLDVPTGGDFAVVALAQRKIADSTEHYCWMVRVSMEGDTQKRLMLTNNNMSTTGSQDSLIRTSD